MIAFKCWHRQSSGNVAVNHFWMTKRIFLRARFFVHTFCCNFIPGTMKNSKDFSRKRRTRHVSCSENKNTWFSNCSTAKFRNKINTKATQKQRSSKWSQYRRGRGCGTRCQMQQYHVLFITVATSNNRKLWIEIPRSKTPTSNITNVPRTKNQGDCWNQSKDFHSSIEECCTRSFGPKIVNT